MIAPPLDRARFAVLAIVAVTATVATPEGSIELSGEVTSGTYVGVGTVDGIVRLQPRLVTPDELTTRGQLSLESVTFLRGRSLHRQFVVIDEEPDRIAEAEHLVLLATGEVKADAIAAAVEGPVTASVPASALQLHPRATVILDAVRESGGAALTAAEGRLAEPGTFAEFDDLVKERLAATVRSNKSAASCRKSSTTRTSKNRSAMTSWSRSWAAWARGEREEKERSAVVWGSRW